MWPQVSNPDFSVLAPPQALTIGDHYTLHKEWLGQGWKYFLFLDRTSPRLQIISLPRKDVSDQNNYPFESDKLEKFEEQVKLN